MPKGVIIGLLVASLGINCEERLAGVWFTDVAVERGLTSVTTFGDRLTTRSILESTGTGAVIFDYDGDGSNDIFVVNGTTFDKPETPSHRSQLYRNDGSGRFTEVGQAAGLTRTGWGQAACSGDFDNDGHPDLLVTYYGRNSLYRNKGDGTFVDVSELAGLPVSGTRWGSGCAFVDYNRDGNLDLFVANYVDL